MAYADTSGVNSFGGASFTSRAAKWIGKAFMRLIEARQRAALARVAPYFASAYTSQK